MAILNAESYSGNYIRKLLTAVVAWLNVSGIDVSREELRRRYRIKLPQGLSPMICLRRGKS